MRRSLLAAVALGVALALAGLAAAWWVKGHEAVAEAACAGLPDDVPAFFRSGAKTLAHCAGDPDRWKNRAAVSLAPVEGPNHYIDLEDYQGKPLPKDRWQAITLLQELKVKPERAGLLPYALMEGYDRLRCAFYDYREESKKEKDKQDAALLRAIEAKCLVHAGTLAHYTGDCAMPLHTTRDYDGRKGDDGKVAQKGIHAKIDGFPEKFGLGADVITRDLKAKEIDDVWERVLAEIKASHAQIDECYRLDREGAFDKPTEESRKFILSRCRAGAQFTMDLWYTAWLRSAKMPKPY
jgi:hypothetical protein